MKSCRALRADVDVSAAIGAGGVIVRSGRVTGIMTANDEDAARPWRSGVTADFAGRRPVVELVQPVNALVVGGRGAGLGQPSLQGVRCPRCGDALLRASSGSGVRTASSHSEPGREFRCREGPRRG